MRRKEMVVIKATCTVARLANRAMMIQNAVNSLPIANFLIDVMEHFRNGNVGQNHAGNDFGLQNPISLSLLNKLNDLAGMEQSKTDCFNALTELGNGNDVEWEINFLV